MRIHLKGECNMREGLRAQFSATFQEHEDNLKKWREKIEVLVVKKDAEEVERVLPQATTSVLAFRRDQKAFTKAHDSYTKSASGK